MAQIAPDSRIGNVFDGRFRVERVLGRSGADAVYLAVDTTTGDEVALKILDRAQAPNEVAAKRFLREMEATRRVQHPNIVHLHDCGETASGQLYIAMEVLKGRTLQRQIRQHGALEPERAALIGAQIAQALQAAHDEGVLHRDLKPSNIRLVSAHGTRDWVKVLDFGIARFLEDDDTQAEQLTAAGKVIGTPHYMSPEQVASRPLDGRSDLYALGVLLYFMVTGQTPFPGRPLEVLRQHVFEKPKPPSAYAPRPVPEALEAIILRLLEKNPEDRFQTGRDLDAALRAAAEEVQDAGFAGISFADELDDPEHTETFPESDDEIAVTEEVQRARAARGWAAALAALGFTAVFGVGLAIVLAVAVVALLLL